MTSILKPGDGTGLYLLTKISFKVFREERQATVLKIFGKKDSGRKRTNDSARSPWFNPSVPSLPMWPPSSLNFISWISHGSKGGYKKSLARQLSLRFVARWDSRESKRLLVQQSEDLTELIFKLDELLTNLSRLQKPQQNPTRFEHLQLLQLFPSLGPKLLASSRYGLFRLWVPATHRNSHCLEIRKVSWSENLGELSIFFIIPSLRLGVVLA